MNSLALIIASLMTLGWYLIDNRKRKNKSPGLPVKGYNYIGYIIKAKSNKSVLTKATNEESAGRSQSPIGRLYYSIPGQTYKGLIQDGHILTTGNRSGFY